MKFNKSVFKSRGFVVMSLTLMLVVVGTVNYNLSKQSVLETSKEMERYEEAQLSKNDDKKEAYRMHQRDKFKNGEKERKQEKDFSVLILFHIGRYDFPPMMAANDYKWIKGRHT